VFKWVAAKPDVIIEHYRPDVKTKSIIENTSL
jgi:hypothetical protein